jgi:hypothetical protein
MCNFITYIGEAVWTVSVRCVVVEWCARWKFQVGAAGFEFLIFGLLGETNNNRY